MIRMFMLLSFVCGVAVGQVKDTSSDSKLVPFLMESENILEYNQAVIKQRSMIRNRRVRDQRRKFKGKYAEWIKQRPHAMYHRTMNQDAPIVLTDPELPNDIVFYDLFPELRRSSRVDYNNRRENDRLRFIDYDRHQTINGETVFEEMTRRYIDE